MMLVAYRKQVWLAGWLAAAAQLPPLINGFNETLPGARTLEKSPSFMLRKIASTSTEYGCEAANWHACCLP
jgi:hypothetical protein